MLELKTCTGCGLEAVDCFNSFVAGRGKCCGDCDKHGARLTDRGVAAVQAMRDGFSVEDAIAIHAAPEDES